jgi:hypothetical protein
VAATGQYTVATNMPHRLGESRTAQHRSAARDRVAGILNEDRADACGLRVKNVALAVADHPRPREVEIELRGGDQNVGGPGLAVEAVISPANAG